MVVVTTEQICGKKIVQVLGLVIGARFLYNVLPGGPGTDLEYTQSNFMAYGTAALTE